MWTIAIERALGPALVQDAGRPGFARFGVPGSGAADPVSLRVGNRLVGNDAGAPALEIALAGGTFAFDGPGTAVLAGSEFDAWIEEPSGARRAWALWTPVAVRASGKIHVGAARGGARVYLCVGGGLVVPNVLGSGSTYAACGLGGWLGRPLRAGDAVPFGGGGEPRRALGADAAESLRAMLRRRVFRATDGAHRDRFPPASRQAFERGTFAVSRRSDRTGLRLLGPAIDSGSLGTMITEGMPPGAVQIPPDGSPIVLFVDGPTTGGYPSIAAVIAADQPALAHLVPGDPVEFLRTDLATARAARRAQAEWLVAIEALP